MRQSSSLVALLWVAAGCGFEVSLAPRPDGGAVDAKSPDAPPGVVDGSTDAPTPPDVAGSCVTTTLSAAKMYSPSVWVDGQVAPTAPHLMLDVPPTLLVTSGNAGNHCAALTFKLADNSLARCRYRGGSSLSSPTSSANATEIQNGRTYVFDGCRGGAACPSANGTMFDIAGGEQVGLAADLTPITLHIDNGDAAAGTTVIEQPLRRCEDL